jgi:phosphate butyryltransferase
MIKSLDQMVDMVLSQKKKYRIAVAWAQDTGTISAINRTVKDGFVEAIMIGQTGRIKDLCSEHGIDPCLFSLVDSENETDASERAVRLVKTGEADIIMKGLVGTDKFLKAVMDKEYGLMLPDAVVSYVGVVEIPAYHKLLFITDAAVIPYPDLKQKVAMAGYAINIARRFGIDTPKIALIGASEKVSSHFQYSTDYAEMRRIAEQGYFGRCIMDGPLDLFLSCDEKSVETKGVRTPVNGDADILLFPSLESCNPFYKSLMLFADGELGGLIMGTSKPVILMSRSESEKSKYYCIALSCLMA